MSCPPHDYVALFNGGAVCNKCRDIVAPLAQHGGPAFSPAGGLSRLLQRSSTVAREVPISLFANGRIVDTVFELDARCEVELLISNVTAHELGFDQLSPQKIRPYPVGGTGTYFRDYVGIVEVSITSDSESIRFTRCANAIVGGTDNLLGLPTMSKLGVGVADSELGVGRGRVCFYPVRTPKIL